MPLGGSLRAGWPCRSDHAARTVTEREEAVMSARMRLSSCGLSAGKRARLHRILYKHGLGNGTALFLPYDQGLEHGPRDFFDDPIASDPKYIVRLALEGGFNGIAIQIGLAEKFYWDYAGEVPLILKLNGKTDIPSDARALSPLHASVEDAVRLGADAVGYTLYVGSPAQESMSAGATGLIFGRNVWQRDHDESLRFVERLREVLAKYPTP